MRFSLIDLIAFIVLYVSISQNGVECLYHKYQYSDEFSDTTLKLERNKRQFENTIFDGLGGINPWKTLQNTEHRLVSDTDTSRIRNINLSKKLIDEKHGVAMGIKDSSCDNAKINLDIDWDGSPSYYTCYLPKVSLPIRNDLKILKTCDDVPSNYIPQHYCMNDVINYNTSLPTFGPHRPLWPIFGEYNYLPPQRWLHNIEHGSIVMLYHPCASPSLVQELKYYVKGCIYKYVISPDVHVSFERPLVLISWGCKLEMPYVDKEMIKSFIKEHALHGPEGKISRQGQYDLELIEASQPPTGSDINDSVLCPSNE